MRFLLYTIFFSVIFVVNSISQETSYKSIHQEQYEYYSSFGFTSVNEFDSVNGFVLLPEQKEQKNYELIRRVFGYNPYWGGSNYLNYQWNLLSDMCHFSYEVDPATGDPVTTHNWMTSVAIDSALINNVKVHLCVTLFSGHSTFFNSATARQNLINNIINLIEARNAHGVNIDVEALPSSYGDDFTTFMIDLCDQMHYELPGSEVSIAAPAVNWSGTFEIEILKDHIDFFMIMGYDYYWNGSSQAGPVSPLYSMVGNYDYNFLRTISYYQSQGVPNEQLVLGIPYYGRQWPTVGQVAPSNTTGSGTAYTYQYIQNNSSGYYSNENKKWEPNSFSPYYAFYTSSWNQCFIEDTYSLGKKYDIVKRRNIAGIGIWALGYDNGYTDLWELIADKFTDNAGFVTTDTIYDSGGPAFNYYNDESYIYTIPAPEEKSIKLTFNYLDLEPGYDSLWIYDGPDITYPLLGSYSGNSNPGTLFSAGNYITLYFFSDVGIINSGWEAVYEVIPATHISESISEENPFKFSVYPNPFKEELYISFELTKTVEVKIDLTGIQNQNINNIFNNKLSKGEYTISVDKGILKKLSPSVYLIRVLMSRKMEGGKIVFKKQ
ncbi:MAG: hypothetical protein H8D45_24115 [Bacteroidetes bacterium]|nr:hypothetical protein [Bacteroidota bacterium]MBL7102957.1 hypothetical protein [Bacteroidales bacterium]